MNIFEPKNLFKSLFASGGDKTIIPDSGDEMNGKANLQAGFPYTTQLPVSQGGIAPDRKDFNGILYMLSAFAFFCQSGGIFTYKNELDYHSPAIISYNGNLWYCLKSNGPGTANSVRVPGTDSSYWTLLLTYLGGITYNQVNTIVDNKVNEINKKVDEALEKINDVDPFKTWKIIPASGTISTSGIIVAVSGWNTNISITTSEVQRVFTHRRDKYGQGCCSVTCPIKKGETYVVSGAQSIWMLSA